MTRKVEKLDEDKWGKHHLHSCPGREFSLCLRPGLKEYPHKNSTSSYCHDIVFEQK